MPAPPAPQPLIPGRNPFRPEVIADQEIFYDLLSLLDMDPIAREAVGNTVPRYVTEKEADEFMGFPVYGYMNNSTGEVVVTDEQDRKGQEWTLMHELRHKGVDRLKIKAEGRFSKEVLPTVSYMGEELMMRRKDMELTEEGAKRALEYVENMGVVAEDYVTNIAPQYLDFYELLSKLFRSERLQPQP